MGYLASLTKQVAGLNDVSRDRSPHLLSYPHTLFPCPPSRSPIIPRTTFRQSGISDAMLDFWTFAAHRQVCPDLRSDRGQAWRRTCPDGYEHRDGRRVRRWQEGWTEDETRWQVKRTRFVGSSCVLFYDILFLRSTISDVYTAVYAQTIYENGPIQLTEIVTGR